MELVRGAGEIGEWRAGGWSGGRWQEEALEGDGRNRTEDVGQQRKVENSTKTEATDGEVGDEPE